MKKQNDMNKYFRDDMFENAIQYARQMSAVKGVAEIITIIYEKKELFEKERDSYIEEKKQTLKTKSAILSRWRKILWLTIAILAIVIYKTGFSVPAVVVIMVGLFIYLFYDHAKTKYKYEIDEIKGMGEILCRKYDTEAHKLFMRIDSLYLASLSPVHRETVMMRRDQQRQHQEMLRLQREHNRTVEDEQRRMRIAQEELLRIEREREERRRY